MRGWWRVLASLALASPLAAQSPVQTRAARALRDGLDDPRSMLIRQSIVINARTVCGRVSARNRLGGMVTSHFVYLDTGRQAVLLDTAQRESRDAIRAACGARMPLEQDVRDIEDDRIARDRLDEDKQVARREMAASRARVAYSRDERALRFQAEARVKSEDSVRTDARSRDSAYQAALPLSRSSKAAYAIVYADTAAAQAIARYRAASPAVVNQAPFSWDRCVEERMPTFLDSIPR